jgi:hypothetical protein
MSRKIRIAHFVAPGGTEYGRVVQPSEHMAMQDYAHRHTEVVTRDLLTDGGAAAVAGFGYALAGGLNLSIAEGHAVDGAGLSFQTYPDGAAAVVAIPAASPAQPRIDLVYATLQAGVETDAGPLAHRRLRTQQELLAGANPYPIENQNVTRQVQNRATVAVRQGVAGAVPVAPAVGANEVALYHVRVEAAAVAVTADKVTDVRNLMRSLRDAWVDIDAVKNSPAILNLGETIDDRVAGLLVDSTYLTKSYNDAGNLLTLDVDIAPVSAAVAAALNPIFVNVSGDDMAGPLRVLMGGTPYAGNAALHGQRAATVAGQSVKGVQGYGEAGVSNGDIAYGGYFDANANRASGVAGTTSIGVFGRTDGGHTRWAGYFEGNVNITGTISKGGGTFHLDHPLDPLNRDLIHGFVESNRHLLVYTFDVQLADGVAGTFLEPLSLDALLGFTEGTCKALMQNIRVTSIRHPAGLHVTDVVAVAEDPGVAVSLQFTSSSGADDSLIVVTITADRADPYIKATEFVDVDGVLIPERDKTELTADEEALLDDASVPLPPGDPRIGETIEEPLPNLIGKVGFPRQPSVIEGGGATPTRSVTFTLETLTVGPYTPATIVDDDSAGAVAWTNPSNAGGDNNAFASAEGVSAALTHYLMATGNPGDLVPEGATILGVVARFRMLRATDSVVSVARVSLVVGGVVKAQDRKADAALFLSQAEAEHTYGGADQLWDEELLPADVNTADFGVALQIELDSNFDDELAVAQVDSVLLTIHYTVGV